MVIISACFLIIVAFSYLLLILYFTTGLFSLKPVIPGQENPHTRVSVIIPTRNEETNIPFLLEDLRNQDYPLHLMELIIANDASTDHTGELVRDFQNVHPGFPLKMINIEEDSRLASPKKHAVEVAISASSGKLILSTDADTRRGKSWISSIVSYYEQYQPVMIIGPVAFHEEHSLFMKFQSLEFLGLNGITAASCGKGNPLMCNAANIAFEKQAFSKINGFSGDEHFASGDDQFLMMRIREKYGKHAVQFILSEKAAVYTFARKHIGEFMLQRIRWVSKSRGYRDRFVIFTALITYLFNLSLLAGMASGIFVHGLLWISLWCLLLKALTDLPPVYFMTAFFHKKEILRYYPIVQVLNLVYVVFTGLAGNLVGFEWKGRKVPRQSTVHRDM